jgi:sterol desaturase/sphingolipid hydroxylase (fatty acid hydroxylase superfamily)
MNLIQDFIIVSFGSFLINLITFSLFNIPYMIIDKYQLFQEYKIIKTEDVSKRKEENKKNLFLKILKSQFTELLPLQILSYPIFYYFNINTFSEFPSFYKFLFQFIIFNIIEDALFYWIHRMFHLPQLYKYHSVHHEFTDTFRYLILFIKQFNRKRIFIIKFRLLIH